MSAVTVSCSHGGGGVVLRGQGRGEIVVIDWVDIEEVIAEIRRIQRERHWEELNEQASDGDADSAES
jgi:hypothetical protein